MTRRLINLRLPLELVDRVDAEAEALGQTRTKYVERALAAALSERPSILTRGGSVPADADTSKFPPDWEPPAARQRNADALARQARLNKEKGL